MRAGTGVGLAACEAGRSVATETSELSPQSLTDILAEGDGRVADSLTRRKTGQGGLMG